MKLWGKFVEWVAGDRLAYLEDENRQLRYELDRWAHRYEGAIAAVRVFESRSNYMMQAIADSKSLEPMEPIILKKEKP